MLEVYGADVSKQTIRAITDRVMEGLADWQSRPHDAVYAVVSIDAINVKIREGRVANRPIYLALRVTVDGDRACRRSQPRTGANWMPPEPERPRE